MSADAISSHAAVSVPPLRVRPGEAHEGVSASTCRGTRRVKNGVRAIEKLTGNAVSLIGSDGRLHIDHEVAIRQRKRTDSREPERAAEGLVPTTGALVALHNASRARGPRGPAGPTLFQEILCAPLAHVAVFDTILIAPVLLVTQA
jgi:hypothetical protein